MSRSRLFPAHCEHGHSRSSPSFRWLAQNLVRWRMPLAPGPLSSGRAHAGFFSLALGLGRNFQFH